METDGFFGMVLVNIKNMNGDRNVMRNVVRGRYSIKFSWLYMSMCHVLLVTALIWSFLYYPEGYNIFTNAVSNLGDPVLNPWPGHFIFSAGICTFGCAMIPHVFYLHRKLAAVQPSWAHRFLITSMIGYVGYVGVGIFSEAPETIVPHAISAAMAFGGLYSSAALSWPPLLSIIRHVKPSIARSGLFMLFIFMIVFSTISIFLAFISAIIASARGYMDPGWLSMLFWEWMLVTALVFHTFLLTAIVNIHMADDA